MKKILILLLASLWAISALAEDCCTLESNESLWSWNTAGTSTQRLMRVAPGTDDTEIFVEANKELRLTEEWYGTGFRINIQAGDILCLESNGSCHLFATGCSSWSVSPSPIQDEDLAAITTWYPNCYPTVDRQGQIRHIAGNVSTGHIRNELHHEDSEWSVGRGSTKYWTVQADTGELEPQPGAMMKVPSGSYLPGDCEAGQVWIDTFSKAFYACVEDGTWKGY